MNTFLLRRLGALIPTLFGVTLITFGLVRLTPGDPVRLLLGVQATKEQLARVTHLLGLDQPWWVQYGKYLRGFVTGDWGNSIQGQGPVLDLVTKHLLITLQLVVASTIVSVVIGLCFGLGSALFPNSWFDKLTRLVTIFAFSMPTFWLGLLLVLFFSVRLGWFPATGQGGLHYLVLPVACLAAWQVGLIARTTRTSAVEVMSQDYVAAARARGLGPRRVIRGYILPNTLIPVVTIVGLQFGTMLGGAVVTEVVFNYNGLGQLTVRSISARDYPVIQGCVLIAAISFMIINLAVDLIYAIVDPRLRRMTGQAE